MRRHFLFGLVLVGITLAVFWPVGHLGFIIYDDCEYVYLNSFVQSGLNLKSIAWAFTADYSSNWHPITWLSHMLDCQLFGLNPGEEHWMNLGIHTANCLLLYALLWWLTGARWRSFLVAGLFAIHPLHVQSVAWIAERKDVLSGFFGLLTLMAYATWVKAEIGKSDSGNFATKDHKETRYAKNYYWLAVGLFALGLMAKPMLVTIPLVMLLLDYWPLGRVAMDGKRAFLASLRPLVVEKWPFFLLCLASCAVTVVAQKAGGAVVSMGAIPWLDRCLHAVLSYPLYLGKLFWPADLSVFYPYTRLTPDDFVCLMLVPILITCLCLWQWRARPYLLMGWLWFVIILIPVIGLVQVGMQSMADRYTYLPSIGLFIAVAWGMAEIAASSKLWQAGMAGAGAILLVACGVDTRQQLGYWKDSVTLFQHAVDVTLENNFIAYYYLGNAFGQIGDWDNAANSMASAVQDAPSFIKPQEKFGYIMLKQKKYLEAETQLREIINIYPNNLYAHKALGTALAGQLRDSEALAEYQIVQQLAPTDPDVAKIMDGTWHRIQLEQTLSNLTQQLATNPTPEIHIQIADALSCLGDYQGAMKHYQQALALNPDSLDGLNNLAWLLATCPDKTIHDGKQAAMLADKACKLTQFKVTVFLGTLAAAQAEAGQFDDAIATAQKAMANATARGETNLYKVNQDLLRGYQGHQAWHEQERLSPPVPESSFEGTGQ